MQIDDENSEPENDGGEMVETIAETIAEHAADVIEQEENDRREAEAAAAALTKAALESERNREIEDLHERVTTWETRQAEFENRMMENQTSLTSSIDQIRELLTATPEPEPEPEPTPEPEPLIQEQSNPTPEAVASESVDVQERTEPTPEPEPSPGPAPGARKRRIRLL
jgi:uncharacterized protein YPO0396